MPNDTDDRDAEWNTTAEATKAHARKPYAAPKVRSLGRVAQLMRGSSGANTDGHTTKKKL